MQPVAAKYMNLCVVKLASQIYHGADCGSKFWIRIVVYNGLAYDRYSIVESMSISKVLVCIYFPGCEKYSKVLTY